MKNLVSIFAALILLAACKEGEQAVNQKESLPEGMSEVVFNQVMTQPWMLDGFESVKRDFALFHGGVKAEELQLEVADILQDKEGYVVVFDYTTKQGKNGQFIVSTLSMMTDGTIERKDCNFSTDMFFLSSLDETDSLEYSLKKNRMGQERLVVNSRKGIVKVGFNNLENICNPDSVMMTLLDDEAKKVNTLVYWDSLGNMKMIQSLGNVCWEREGFVKTDYTTLFYVNDSIVSVDDYVEFFNKFRKGGTVVWVGQDTLAVRLKNK